MTYEYNSSSLSLGGTLNTSFLFSTHTQEYRDETLDLKILHYCIHRLWVLSKIKVKFFLFGLT